MTSAPFRLYTLCRMSGALFTFSSAPSSFSPHDSTHVISSFYRLNHHSIWTLAFPGIAFPHPSHFLVSPLDITICILVCYALFLVTFQISSSKASICHVVNAMEFNLLFSSLSNLVFCVQLGGIPIQIQNWTSIFEI